MVIHIASSRRIASVVNIQVAIVVLQRVAAKAHGAAADAPDQREPQGGNVFTITSGMSVKSTICTSIVAASITNTTAAIQQVGQVVEHHVVPPSLSVSPSR